MQVSNSTGEDGLGATAASELQTHGFNVITPDDYPGPLDTTTVFFSPGNEQAAATVASAFPNPTIERATNLGDVVQVVLGSDFYSVTSPPSSGSPRAGPRGARHQQRSDRTARGSSGHQRRRHHLRIAAAVGTRATGIHLPFTMHVVTIRQLRP